METVDIPEDYNDLLRTYFELKKESDYMQCIGTKYAQRMNYDFNTLLNSITGYLYAALENADPSLKSSVEGALKTTKVLTGKVNDMTDCMSLFMGGYSLRFAPTQLRLVLRQVNQEIDELLSVKKLSFEYEIDDAVPNYVETDYSAVKKVMSALIHNAIHNSSNGVIDVSVAYEKDMGDEAVIKFSVSDCGDGVDESSVAKILENSTMHFGSLSKNDLGGFGILIARDYLRLLGSELKFENNTTKGVTFYFLLKIKKVYSSFDTAKGQHMADAAKKSLDGMKILLADDSLIIQQMAKQMLEREGAVVTAVVNGEDAVSSFSANKYDVVFMDVEMPVLNGRDASKQINNIKNSKQVKTPIIGMTAHTSTEEYDKCIASGMEDVMQKPFKVDDIIAIIYKIIFDQGYVAEFKDDEITKTSVYRFDKIKGINYKDALKHLGGNEKLYFELIQKFRDNYSDIYVNISTLLKEGNDSEVKNLLHLIKGVSGNLSFNEIYDYAGKLREAVECDNFPEITTYLRLFDEAMTEFIYSFNEAEVDILCNMSEMLDMDLMLVKNRMDELAHYLSGDIDLGNAIDACDDIYDYMQETEYKKDFIHIKDAINNFDLELALQLLKSFIERF